VNLSLLPASLPLWAKIALPVAVIILPGGSLLPVVWLAVERRRARGRAQARVLAADPAIAATRRYNA
jgi:hypothetical protein